MSKDNTDQLLKAIIEGIKEKKGSDIISIDLSKHQNVVCRYFVICHADSTTQVNAIAGSIEEFTRNTLNEKVWKREGTENSQWILLDYASIVVHVFQTQYRNFYNLENLWADAKIKKFN
ncbi:MAG: ribosome silencing factor [Bacteroidetes bacterium GWF2_38_335]|nr:MAG: ribosome silencing factor [Bacteroidetes bacterium GWF2_38_335]OFY78159.1 MAG: ribosome silencing factor [Bacteroidetes bacterium RIFOXYA12_FULL_38_20]HBS88681.1 ribosome silencing factor [Bacteroidales bacterium]